MKEKILTLLNDVRHPEKKESIVTLQWVDLVVCTPELIKIAIRYPKAKDPFSKSINARIRAILANQYPETPVEVEELFHTPDAAQTHIRSEALSKIKNIVGVSSCKGGVGKSTITVNLAVTLAKNGLSVGLIDADIYGPSIPKMFGLEDTQVTVVREKGAEKFIPPEVFGIKVLSIGFFVGKHDPLIWRGPMATSAIKQLLEQTNWGKLDVLLIDMPPGTGDVHLTLFQQVKLSGALIVTTPQPVAVVDAIKGVNMFKTKDIDVPIWGVVENMAWFTPKELPDHKYYIFGKGGGAEMASQYNIPLLGQVPIIQSIREGGDSGEPAVIQYSEIYNIFNGITAKLPLAV